MVWETFTDPAELQIDHMVPLREAHISGADRWTADRRRAYFNDLDFEPSLIAVAGWVNGSKGARDPAGWLPPNSSYHCAYVEAWVAVKARWDLEMDLDEMDAVEGVLASCQR